MPIERARGCRKRQISVNSKERVRAALDRKPVDKVPLGFYVVDHDTISHVIGRPTYVRNKPGLQLAFWEGRRDEVVESMKEDVTDFYNKIDCADLLTFKQASLVPPRGYKPVDAPKKIAKNTYGDARGNVWKIAPEANDVMLVHDADEPEELPTYSLADFEDRTPPEKPDPTVFELQEHLVNEFGDDRYIAGCGGGVIGITLLGGTEYGLMTMALQPEVIRACNRRLLYEQNIMDEYVIRPGIDGILTEHDMAGSNGPLVSPAMFRELCFPYYRERIQRMKKLVPHVILHNCGNNMPIMDMLVDGGIDCYQSIQTTSEMSIRKLAQSYGDRICVWGAVALEHLVSGTPDDVRKSVRQCFEEAGETPGFILGPSHSIAFGTKYENFMAMLDEFVKLRDRS